MQKYDKVIKHIGGKRKYWQRFRPKILAAMKLKLITTHKKRDNEAMNEYRANRLSSVVQSTQSKKHFYLSQKTLTINLERSVKQQQ
jgi:hypothetical protein